MANPNTSACAHARFLAALAPDRTLSELEQQSLLRHLDQCVECRTFARSVAAVTRELRDAPQVRMSKAFSAPQRRPRRTFGAPLVTATTVAAAMLVTSLALRDPPRHTAPPPSGPALIANAPVENEQVVLRQFRDLSLARRVEPERNPRQPGMYVG
jgi:hypothetical protein